MHDNFGTPYMLELFSSSGLPPLTKEEVYTSCSGTAPTTNFILISMVFISTWCSDGFLSFICASYWIPCVQNVRVCHQKHSQFTLTLPKYKYRLLHGYIDCTNLLSRTDCRIPRQSTRFALHLILWFAVQHNAVIYSQ